MMTGLTLATNVLLLLQILIPVNTHFLSEVPTIMVYGVKKGHLSKSSSFRPGGEPGGSGYLQYF